MVKFFWVISCILATWTVVVAGRGHISAPVQPPAPAPVVDCSNLIYDMVDCISYLSVGGGENKPEKSCCSGFKTVLETDSDCICVALKSSASMGIDVNMTSAMALPSACGINAPPLNCNISTSPGTSPVPGASPVNPPPVNAPAPTSPNSPTTSPTPSGPSVPAGALAPSPAAAISGVHTICATILSILFTVSVSVFTP
ncbi:Bifunctional inhibitor/lipid-transfer protein/seed storage 2S albumin superfamily protein [Forsythia ovata]|uniref:Bifunctional inhibitor/lipid-transfer protein/seed storage 2S albumin superfamily protein n=1 Tax=Forsythia ovata TaxID=205694 RepID=A0ABD1PVW6_9LAMI